MLRYFDNSRSPLPLAWVLGVLMAGILLSLSLFQSVRRWEAREVELRCAELAHAQIDRLKVIILRSMEVLHSVAALNATGANLDRTYFRDFVQPALRRQPELQALSWNPLVLAADRTMVETKAAADGLTGYAFRELTRDGTMVTAGDRSEYVPVLYIEPLKRNAAALGLDLDSDPLRRGSLEQARDTGQPVVTMPIRLAQGQGDEAGFLVLMPVYDGADDHRLASVEERRSSLRGFAVAVFRVADLVADVFYELSRQGIEARLHDQTPSGELLYQSGRAEHGSVAWLNVGSRRWAVAFAPTAEFVAAQSHGQSWIVLGGGLSFALLATGYTYGGWRRTKEIAATNSALHKEVRTRQEAERAAAQANEAKSDFLANMSHEIRTPLNAILGYAQLMRRDPHLAPEQHDAIAGIHASGQHLLGLINEVLDLAKIEAGRMELIEADFDLQALARGLVATFKPLCAQKRIGFRVVFDDAVAAQVRGDEGKLRQVLINLLGNAVKFTQAGAVSLHVRSERTGRWLFEVLDTGLGIPHEEQADIFTPFHQGSGARHQGGTGLGLAIARRQVELLGGVLSVHSERGVGSRFYFDIPLAAAASPLPQTLVERARLSPATPRRVLVIDDHPGNRQVLGGLLASLGCQVWQTESPEEALSLALQHRPHIVFLDWVLPGVNTTEFARRLACSASPTAKIIMHTASALARHREEARAAGCVGELSKPFTAEQLCHCLEEHVGAAFEKGSLETQADAETPPPLDPNPIVLPEALCARLMVAAELHSSTALKAALPELRALGPEAYALAEHLRHLIRSFDMDRVQQLLVRCVAARSENAPTPLSHEVCGPPSGNAS